jgi:sugar phosphate isomerase/epimerase
MLTGLSASRALPALERAEQQDAEKTGSRWGGVQVGLTVPGSLGTTYLSAGEIMAACVSLGVSAVELAAPPVETFLRAPVPPACSLPMPDDGLEVGLQPLEVEVMQDELDLARATFEDHLRRWRIGVSLAPLADLRREYEEAGVRIEIIRWTGLAVLSDDEVDYGFRVARALGARALSTGLSGGAPRRLARFAERHRTFVGFHGSPAPDAGEFESAFSHGSFIGANLDVARWAAAGYGSPVAFLAQHAGRITHVQVTDPKSEEERGDAPIREVLQAMRAKQWPFQATIAFEERPGPADRESEVAAALDYCRSCLMR